MDDATKLEALIVEEYSKAYGQHSVDDLIAQRDADIKRFTNKTTIRTPEEIRARLGDMLVLSLEVKGEHCEEERWCTGVEGAILEGRMSILREIMDWILGMRCSECGYNLAEGSNFCNHCGASTVKVTLERVD
jgi:hypothetical protein